MRNNAHVMSTDAMKDKTADQDTVHANALQHRGYYVIAMDKIACVPVYASRSKPVQHVMLAMA